MDHEWPLIGRDPILDRIRQSLSVGPVVLIGEMGVGKSRLAIEVAERFHRDGWHVEKITASASSQTIPFGAFVHLVPTLPAGDLFRMLERASSVVSRMGRDEPLLLVVEDAQHLDPGSEALLERIIREGSIRVLVTMRSTRRPDALPATLVKEDQTVIVEVPPLTKPDTTRLLESVVGSRLDEAFVQSLWTLTEGNPLFVREIVENARSSGSLVDTGTEVTVRRPLSPSTRLAELIGLRLANLPPERRRVLDLIAVIEPAPLHLISHLVDLEELDRLVEGGLLRLTVVAGHETVQPAHPLYGEILRSAMVRERRKELARTTANALVGQDELRPGTALVAAVWLVDAEVEPDRDLALVAAEEALAKSDPALAARLGRIALAQGEATRALVVVGTALSVQGETAGARELLARSVEMAEGEELTAAGLAYSRHLLWMEHRFEESEKILDHVLDRVSPASRPLVRVEQASQLAPQGKMERALAAVTAVLDDDDADELAVLGALVWSTLIRAMLGRLDGLESDLERAGFLAEKHEDAAPLTLDQIGANRLMRDICVDLDLARDLVVDGEQRAHERGGAVLIWTVCRAWVELVRGEVEPALETTRRSLEEAEAFDPFGNQAMALSTRALALAHAGRATEADRILLSLDSASLEPRTRVWFDRARYWIAAHRDHLSTIDFRSDLERAREAGLTVWASDLAFDAVRLGRAGPVVDTLADLALLVSGDSMVRLYAEAAAAALGGDADEVIRVADDLLARRALLPAADLTARAASLTRGPAAHRLETRAFALLRACPGARPPVFAHLDHPLTEREREVGRRAARGAMSREIAASLFVSARTVDNHLARVYRKLDLSGREELSSWFPVVSAR